MKRIKLAACVSLLALLALPGSAQTSGSPSYKDPDYRPRVSATAQDVVGHFTQSGNRQVDVWFARDGTARVRFVDAPDSPGHLGSVHEYAATWKIRNGWVDLASDLGEVVLEFDPETSTLMGKHALRSSLLLSFQTLSKDQAR